MRRPVVVLLAALLVGSLSLPAVAHSPPADDGYDPRDDIQLTYELRPTVETGTVRVTVTARLPSHVERFEFGPPPDAEVQVLKGFVRDGEELPYAWKGEVDRPSMTYERVVNETGVPSRVAAGAGWAILTRADVGGRAYWRYYGEAPTLHETVVAPPDESAFVGDTLVVTGPHEIANAKRNGERFRLVVPQAAALAADRDAISESLEFASGELDVGHRHDETVGVVQPGELRRGGFVADGGWPEFAVHEDQRARGVANAWIHEYVHTRQNFSTTDRLAWIVEASAEYEAGLLTLQHGNASWSGFVDLATETEYADADLRAPESRGTLADYEKGAAVVAAIDWHVRNATDGERSIETVLGRMNEREAELAPEDFKAIVADVAGEPIDAEIDRMVTGRFEPTPPDDPFVYTTGPDADNDRDGLTTAAEREAGTHPFLADTDRDGRTDGDEVAAGTDPTVPTTPETATSTPSKRTGDADPSADASTATRTTTAADRTETAGGNGALPLGTLLAVTLLAGASLRLARRCHSS